MPNKNEARLSEDLLWGCDEETGEVWIRDHLIYLHQNGHLILKPKHYEFSPSSFTTEGGFVVSIWNPPISLLMLRVSVASYKRFVTKTTYDDLDELERYFTRE